MRASFQPLTALHAGDRSGIERGLQRGGEGIAHGKRALVGFRPDVDLEEVLLDRHPVRERVMRRADDQRIDAVRPGAILRCDVRVQTARQ